MKTSATAVLLLLMLITGQAIRLLPDESPSSSHGKQLHEVGRSNEEDALCKDRRCSGTSTAPVTNRRWTSEKGEGVVEVKPKANLHESSKLEKKGGELSVSESTARDPDVFDLAGMDYSTARRKPPIHN